jgi:hypothetical protein
MGEQDYYYVLEHHENKIVKVHRVDVGTRRIGLNAQVRSMLAFGNFESDRKVKAFNNAIQPNTFLPRSFRVMSSGQYQAALERNDLLADFVANELLTYGVAFTEHSGPKSFCESIGYDRVKKRYIQSS